MQPFDSRPPGGQGFEGLDDLGRQLVEAGERAGQVHDRRGGLCEHQVDRRQLLAGQGVAPGPEVGPDEHDRRAEGVGQAALEARPAVGIGAVEDRDDGVGRAHSVDVDLEDRLGVEGLDRQDLGLRQEQAWPAPESKAASLEVPGPLGLGEERRGEVEVHSSNPPRGEARSGVGLSREFAGPQPPTPHDSGDDRPLACLRPQSPSLFLLLPLRVLCPENER